MSTIIKRELFGIPFSITDYTEATKHILKNAEGRISFGVSALAVHGLVIFNDDPNMNSKIRSIDMILPDGQPIKWALNIIHKSNLRDRVCGPDLVYHLLLKSNSLDKIKIYLYGSTDATIVKFVKYINDNFPNVCICGYQSDRFREATIEEDNEDIKYINSLEPNIVLVGRGCPRQEIWVADHIGKINAVMIAVGAAFDFHSGNLKRPPNFIQEIGMEWFYRLLQEPQRLFMRYLTTNSKFIYLFVLHYLKKIEG